MAAGALTEKEKELKEDILSELGSPTVKVEIDDDAWPRIFKSAKRWFQARKGVVGSAMVSASSREIALPADAEVPLDVILPGSSSSCILTAGFFPDISQETLLLNNGAVSIYSMSMSEYVQVLQSLSTASRILGFDNGWTWDECRGRIILTGRVPSGLAMVCYKKKIENWTPDVLRDRDEDFFHRQVMIEAKIRLGRVRSKYPSYPAAGGEVSMDGDKLLDEAKEDQEILNEEIAQSQMPIPMVRG